MQPWPPSQPHGNNTGQRRPSSPSQQTAQAYLSTVDPLEPTQLSKALQAMHVDAGDDHMRPKTTRVGLSCCATIARVNSTLSPIRSPHLLRVQHLLPHLKIFGMIVWGTPTTLFFILLF